MDRFVWRFLARLGLASLLVAALACSDDPTEPLPPCTASVELTATGGTSPTFSWTPACGARSLTVDPQPPSQGVAVARWSVFAQPALLTPGIRYGQVPSGAAETAPAVPLEQGEPYTVILGGANGEQLAFVRIEP